MRFITHSSLFIFLFYYPIMIMGILVFILTRKTPHIAYRAMRKVYAIKGPSFTKPLSSLCDKLDYKNWKKESPSKESIFHYGENQIHEIAQTIKKDGYCVLPFQLPENFLQHIENLAKNAEYEIRSPALTGMHKIDLNKPLGGMYNFSEENGLLLDNHVSQLVHDSLFLDISRAYLGTAPVTDLVNMSWVMPVQNPDKVALAQMYHFDLDRLNFIKFFIYIIDVDATNGPHCFIKGSHTNKSRDLCEDRRYSDEEVYRKYGKESEIMMIGRRGMIIAEDTSGFHKGLSPEKGSRLMLQLEYSSSLFGQTYNRFAADSIAPEVRPQLANNPILWQRFL